VLLVNLLAALNFSNVFLNKNRLENKKNVKKRKKTFFTSMASPGSQHCANCIGTLSFPIDGQRRRALLGM